MIELEYVGGGPSYDGVSYSIQCHVIMLGGGSIYNIAPCAMCKYYI